MEKRQLGLVSLMGFVCFSSLLSAGILDSSVALQADPKDGVLLSTEEQIVCAENSTCTCSPTTLFSETETPAVPKTSREGGHEEGRCPLHERRSDGKRRDDGAIRTSLIYAQQDMSAQTCPRNVLATSSSHSCLSQPRSASSSFGSSAASSPSSGGSSLPSSSSSSWTHVLFSLVGAPTAALTDAIETHFLHLYDEAADYLSRDVFSSSFFSGPSGPPSSLSAADYSVGQRNLLAVLLSLWTGPESSESERGASSFSSDAPPLPLRSVWADFSAFVSAVNWSEPFNVCLLVFHALLFTLSLCFSFGRFSLQCALLLSLSLLLLFGQKLNRLAHAYWPILVDEPYFDPKGDFVIWAWCMPLLFSLLSLVFVLLFEASKTLIKLKRRRLRQPARVYVPPPSS